MKYYNGPTIHLLENVKLYKKSVAGMGYQAELITYLLTLNKTYKEILNSKNSTLVLKDAVRRMLKDGPLSRKQLKNLYIYSNDKHPHTANNPLTLDFNN